MNQSAFEKKQFLLESWKTVLLTLLTLTAITATFMFFQSSHEHRINAAVVDAFNRLGDDSPAVRVSATVDLVRYAQYKKPWSTETPYRNQIIAVLQNSLINCLEGCQVRQAKLQALHDIDPEALLNAKIRWANFCQIDLANMFFNDAVLEYANISQAFSQEYKPGEKPASFRTCNFFRTNMNRSEFWGVNFQYSRFEETDMSDSFFIEECNFKDTHFWKTNLRNAQFTHKKDSADFNGATFQECILDGANFAFADLTNVKFIDIKSWDEHTNFSNVKAANVTFTNCPDFEKWAKTKFNL